MHLRFYIIGGSAYPSLDWIITPYKYYGNLSRRQKRFNLVHSSTRICVENSFGLLKKRFRRIQYFMELHNINRIVNLTTAACILHNQCLAIFGDILDLQDENEGDENELENQFDHIENNDRRLQVFTDLLLRNIT